VFAGHRGIECGSAGLNNDADNPVTPELVEWAELIFVMEKAHRTKLGQIRPASEERASSALTFGQV
jgi:predicted protein tyrosine phosphatase